MTNNIFFLLAWLTILAVLPVLHQVNLYIVCILRHIGLRTRKGILTVKRKDRQDNCRIQNTKKKTTNKQKKVPFQIKKIIKKKKKNQTNKQNQTGIVFSVFRDTCVNILQKHGHILQFQITPCI